MVGMYKLYTYIQIIINAFNYSDIYCFILYIYNKHLYLYISLFANVHVNRIGFLQILKLF